MTISQVRYVCEIAKSGSMTKAANRFFISQPALSEQMKSLETELGCTLFRRTARGTELTEAGERFCREAEPVVRTWEKFEHSCTALKEMPWGTARIGFGLRARSNGLFEPIVGFVDGYPDVSFSMITDMHENFPDAVASGRLDIAIERVYDTQLSGLSDRIALFPLIWEPQCILMSRMDPLCREACLPIRVLDGKTAVCGPVDSGDDLEMKKLCTRDGVRLSRVLRADDINAVMALVQRGKGYALGPVSFADYFGVAAVPLQPEMQVALYLLCRREEQNSALIRRLQKHLKESLASRSAADG